MVGKSACNSHNKTGRLLNMASVVCLPFYLCRNKYTIACSNEISGGMAFFRLLNKRFPRLLNHLISITKYLLIAGLLYYFLSLVDR